MTAAQSGGAWGSALSTGEFAAITSVGFEPVGQVLGAAVYHIGSARIRYGCRAGLPARSSQIFKDESYQAYLASTSFSSYSRFEPRRAPAPDSSGPSAPSVPAGPARTSRYEPVVRALQEARRAAIMRMAAECARLGGQGVVGVSLTMGEFPAGGLEFTAIGTAVRAPGAMVLPRPFTSGLSGQDFARLIASGVVPVGLAIGISIGARHDWTGGGHGLPITGVEVSGYTDLVNATRREARDQLERDVRDQGADGVVIQAMDLRIRKYDCRAQGQEGIPDHVCEVTIIGTAITHFAGYAPGTSRPSLTIMAVDAERRLAASARALRQDPQQHAHLSVLDAEA